MKYAGKNLEYDKAPINDLLEEIKDFAKKNSPNQDFNLLIDNIKSDLLDPIKNNTINNEIKHLLLNYAEIAHSGEANKNVTTSLLNFQQFYIYFSSAAISLIPNIPALNYGSCSGDLRNTIRIVSNEQLLLKTVLNNFDLYENIIYPLESIENDLQAKIGKRTRC